MHVRYLCVCEYVCVCECVCEGAHNVYIHLHVASFLCKKEIKKTLHYTKY